MLCGGAKTVVGHILGEGGCFREWVPEEWAPVFVDEFTGSLIDWYRIPPESEMITDYALKQQLHYHYHDRAQQWSRPKDLDSWNSCDTSEPGDGFD